MLMLVFVYWAAVVVGTLLAVLRNEMGRVFSRDPEVIRLSSKICLMVSQTLNKLQSVCRIAA